MDNHSSTFDGITGSTAASNNDINVATNSPEIIENGVVDANSTPKTIELDDGHVEEPTISPNNRKRAATDENPCRVQILHNEMLQAMHNWKCVNLDGTELPAVLRNGEPHVAVHMIQLRLLSRFQATLPDHIARDSAMVSHKMTQTEAWTFNAINATLMKFVLGCHIYGPNDEVVRFQDVKLFYWVVKEYNLTQIIKHYDDIMHQVNLQLPLLSFIGTLKKHVENELDAIKDEIAKARSPSEWGGDAPSLIAQSVTQSPVSIQEDMNQAQESN